MQEHKKERKLINLRERMSENIIGQHDLIRNLLISLLCNGHILIEGMPGLAKTTASKTLANSLEGNFHRIQFTPDLLPSDLTGTEIYNHQTGEFSFRKGPLFNNFILADEINRAPAKVQSALLEAMCERQITIGNKTYKLPELYMIIATQNPIEQEGTYDLPEAQLDRFMMHVEIDYPNFEEELKIIDLEDGNLNPKLLEITSQKEILNARKEVSQIHISQSLKEYVVSIILATRKAEKYNTELSNLIKYGASPRATLALIDASKALAWLENSEYVTPYHIQVIAPYILSHRIISTPIAEMKSITKKSIIKRLLEFVAVP